jgi:DNA-directed RNA polymerase specialized sigma24 family protein
MIAGVIPSLTAEAMVLEKPIAGLHSGGGNETAAPAPREISRQTRSERSSYANHSGNNPDMWLYRDCTVALLKRYMRLSVEVGRLPSLLGREFFRTRVTSHQASTFEDSVIFVHDVERSLERLDGFDQELIVKMVLQEYSQDETARLLGCWRRTVGRRYSEALDQLSEIFLEGGLL